MANRMGSGGLRDLEGVNRSSADRSDDSAIEHADRENIRGVGDGADEEEEYEVEEFEDTDEDIEDEDESI